MESILDRLAAGLAAGFTFEALFIITAGIVIGIVVGAAPGLGPTVGMAVMLPFALTLSPEHAVFLLVAILVGSGFGNSIPAVLVKVPGTAGALLTVEEGYPFQQRGEGGRALLICLVSVVIGGAIGTLVFIAFVIPLSAFAIRLLFPEVFAIVVFGLLTAVGLISGQVAKGLIALAFGLLLAVIGSDPVSGLPRYAFGNPNLSFGLHVIPVTVGLLAFREVFLDARKPDFAWGRVNSLSVRWLSSADWKAISWPVAVGTGIGLVLGAVPGAGATVAAFVAYQAIKSIARDKSQFGRGHPGALAGIDASNNAAAAGELIPTFGLGIPGGAPMVVVMAALTAQGLIPGPTLLQTRPELLYATFGGLMSATLVLAIVGYLIIGPSVYLSRLSRPAVITTTMLLVVVGTFSLRWSMFDVWVCFVMGLIGYVMTRRGYPVAPAALGFILGKMMEASLRRGLIMADGWIGFLSRPGTAIMLGLAVIAVTAPPLVQFIRHRRGRGTSAVGT